MKNRVAPFGMLLGLVVFPLGCAITDYAPWIGHHTSGEAKLVFDVGQGTQDLGFRNELNVLFDCQPAVKVGLEVLDDDGKTPVTGQFVFRDRTDGASKMSARIAAEAMWLVPRLRRDAPAALARARAAPPAHASR